MEKNIQELMKALQEPFTEDELEFRVGATNVDKTKGLALAYVQARCIQNRLDQVLGMENWKVSYRPIEGGFICSLELRLNGEWISREDGANNTEFEPIKGGISSAFKRVASVWGIGRYLYEVESKWYPIEKQGKGYGFTTTPKLKETKSRTVEIKEESISPPQSKLDRAKSIAIDFGKYKGKTLGEVYQQDSKYLSYIIDKGKDENMKNACRYLLEKSA
ncbi:MAG: Rad52/Rad22 family DNA repair protein [Fusobacteriaceae bacterium]